MVDERQAERSKMKHLFLVLLFTTTPSYASSLFFTPQESTQIQQAIRNNRQAANAKHIIHMGSLLYFNQDHWVVWLRGKKWTPQTKPNSLTIHEVTADSVKLTIKHPVLPHPKTVTLHPHQSFNLLNGKIIEGY